MTQLQTLWKKYSAYSKFNLSVLPEEIKAQGVRLVYQPQSFITTRGAFPEYIYFMESGIALGCRQYHTGNNYYYFKLTPDDGTIGLLEILSRESQCVATVIASTEVTVLRISSSVIYEYLMTHPDMLQSCIYIVSRDLYQRSANDGLLYYQSGIDRMRYYLVQYYDLYFDHQSELAVSEDYQTIADSIGISVRTVVRSVQKLKDLGEITSIKKKIYISPRQYQIMLEKINQLVHM